MSESTPSDYSVFERLKTSMVDPYVERTMRRAKEYEAAVNETEANEDERNELIAELDREWVYYQTPLVVTGDIWMITPESTEPEKVSVVDMPTISNGFMFDPDRLVFDGEPMLGLQRISHALLIPTGRPDGLPNYAAMHLGDVKHIDYPFPSPELREQRFRYHFERQADEIDEAFMSATDDGDMITLLRDFSLDVDASNPDDVQAIADGQAYMNRILDFDTELPYFTTMMGAVVALTGEESNRTHTSVTAGALLRYYPVPVKSLVTIEQVVLQPADLTKDISSGTHRYIPYVKCVADSRSKRAERQNLLIPFSSIARAESIRDLL